ncbi:MAG: ABC transporter ATP-binding protein [Verrucomicrobiota bacterium]
MAALLRARGLTKRYGDVVALDGAEFEIEDTVTGLLGPNGAGKSTAIKLFLGLLAPTGGVAEVLGETAAGNPSVRARLGYMPEHDCLPQTVSAAEFLTHMAGVSGLPPAHARARAAETLRHVGLFEERYRPIGGYSTGMKQRVKLAQALVHDPLLVLLDEPMAGLDPTGRDEMLDLVRKTHRDFGISVVLSSHIMGDVERVCEHIVVLEAGRVAQQGQIAAFAGDTPTLYVEVTAGRDEFVAALRERSVLAAVEDGTVVIANVDDRGYDVIRDALAASGSPLRRMAPRRRALTELFRDGEGRGP